MNNKLKQELYLQKALKAKGFELKELLLKSADSIMELQISHKLKEFIIEMKNTGSKVLDEMKIKELLNDQKTERVHTNHVVVDEYAEVSEEDKEELKKVQEEKILAKLGDDVELVEKKKGNSEVLGMVKEVVKAGSSRSTSAYIKLIKSNIPEQMLKEVDITAVNSIISEHIAELRSKDAEQKAK